MNDQIPDDHPYKKAIEEIRALNEADRKEEEQKRLSSVRCPDCNALLKIESTEDLPSDIKLTFVEHST